MSTNRIFVLIIFSLLLCLKSTAFSGEILDEKLLVAVTKGSIADTKKFISEGADVNQYSKGGFPFYTGHRYPLFMVAFLRGEMTDTLTKDSNYYKIIQILSDNNANFNAPVISPKGYLTTPFMVLYIGSKGKQNNNMIKLYLEFPNIDVNLRQGDETFLMLASGSSGVIDLEILEMLLKKGAAVNAKNSKDGRTAMIYCVAKKFGPEAIKLLIAYGADKNLKDDYGKTALDYAIEFKDNKSELALRQAYQSGNNKKSEGTPLSKDKNIIENVSKIENKDNDEYPYFKYPFHYVYQLPDNNVYKCEVSVPFNIHNNTEKADRWVGPSMTSFSQPEFPTLKRYFVPNKFEFELQNTLPLTDSENVYIKDMKSIIWSQIDPDDPGCEIKFGQPQGFVNGIKKEEFNFYIAHNKDHRFSIAIPKNININKFKKFDKVYILFLGTVCDAKVYPGPGKASENLIGRNGLYYVIDFVVLYDTRYCSYVVH